VRSAQKLCSGQPELLEQLVARRIQAVGSDYEPANAAELLDQVLARPGRELLARSGVWNEKGACHAERHLFECVPPRAVASQAQAAIAWNDGPAFCATG
jgi:hypothetical protein